MKYILLLLITLLTIVSKGQGVVLNTEEAQESYTLYNDRDFTYLINNCGGIINMWEYGDNDFHLHPKFLPNGNIFFNKPIINDEKHDLLEVDWEGNTVRRIEENREDFFLYYENIALDNGNFLCVAREVIPTSAFVFLGFSQAAAQSAFYGDMIVEITPDGEIVWEWHIVDHIIQERDPSAFNYGVISEHPELLDLDVISNSVDWNFSESFMINSFDYNAELDQIAISVRKMGEIVIIDHSTTTEEAAGHTGGNNGKGGDILWRWGNPENYGAGTEANRYLYYQHNPNWIDKGPHIGKMNCFNNGLGRPGVTFSERYSTVPLINTGVLPDGTYERDIVTGQYSPEGLELDYSEPSTGTEFYSSYTSGAEFLDNGNVHVTVGAKGRMFEINPEGELVWDYFIEDDQYIYRSEKYNINNPIFQGKDLSVKGQIASDYNCDLYTATLELADVSIDYKIAANHLELNSLEMITYHITNISGNTLKKNTSQGYQIESISDFKTGIYFLTFEDGKGAMETVKFFKY